MDPGCFKVLMEKGLEISVKREGISPEPLRLGSHSSISRTVNLKEVFRNLKTQTAEVWWEFQDIRSEKLSFRIYEWDLDSIEACIQTDQGRMVLEFFPEKAPLTVKNFVDLTLEGFYDGLTFHRVVPEFMIQGGCPNGNGTGDPGYFIPLEPNDISHVRGVVSMARSDDPDSGGCQFFIMHGDNPNLDGLYAAFGRVVSGLDTLDRLAQVETTHQRYSEERSRPIEAPRIERITIRPKLEDKKKLRE
jgi:cyclophilin family peptidyl-prolyl cis-trans isomerase